MNLTIRLRKGYFVSTQTSADLKQLSAKLGRTISGQIAHHDRDVQELANLLGLSAAGLKKVLSGSKPLTIDELALTAKWLDVSIGSLLSAAVLGDESDMDEAHKPKEIVVVSIVIPVHNEERTVAHVIENLVLQKMHARLEIIVVDDGSTDRTAAILEELKSIYEIRVIRLEQNRGKGNAVRTGIQAATGTHLLIFDADSEYDPHDIDKLIKPILRKRADLVFGVRVQGVNTTHPTLLHAVGNKLMTLSTNLLYGSSISDLHTCLKLVRLSVLKSFILTEKGFGLDTEITAELLRRGYRPYEVAISYIGRSKAEGKHINASDALRCFYVLAKVRVRSNPKTSSAQVPAIAALDD